MANRHVFCVIQKKPDPAVDTTNDVKFRADVGFLCWRCHPPMLGSFFDKHFLVRPSSKTLQILYETEEKLIVIFPLVPRGASHVPRVTTSTKKESRNVRDRRKELMQWRDFAFHLSVSGAIACRCPPRNFDTKLSSPYGQKNTYPAAGRAQ